MRQGCDISPRFVLNLILLNSFTSRSNDISIVDIVANRFYGLPNHSRRGRVTVIMVCLTVFFPPLSLHIVSVACPGLCQVVS